MSSIKRISLLILLMFFCFKRDVLAGVNNGDLIKKETFNGVFTRNHINNSYFKKLYEIVFSPETLGVVIEAFSDVRQSSCNRSRGARVKKNHIEKIVTKLYLLKEGKALDKIYAGVLSGVLNSLYSTGSPGKKNTLVVKAIMLFYSKIWDMEKSSLNNEDDDEGLFDTWQEDDLAPYRKNLIDLWKEYEGEIYGSDQGCRDCFSRLIQDDLLRELAQELKPFRDGVIPVKSEVIKKSLCSINNNPVFQDVFDDEDLEVPMINYFYDFSKGKSIFYGQESIDLILNILIKLRIDSCNDSWEDEYLIEDMDDLSLEAE